MVGQTPEAVGRDPSSELRQRKPHLDGLAKAETRGVRAEPESNDLADDEVVWGKTADGNVFRVPPTHSFLHTLLTTFATSHLTRVTLATLALQPIIYYLLSSYPTLRSAFFMLYFAFWRGAYDFGFAWMLRKQSEKKWIVRTLRRWGWLEIGASATESVGKYYTQSGWAAWWKRELGAKMGPAYVWEDVPQEFNSWLIFRQLVDIVLLNDFLSYSLFAIANLHFPHGHSVFTHILRWVVGWTLIVFNLWVKIDAHRVVKDYAWYWGDAFWLIVQQRDLVFDGVYEIAPHPMYSVGYAGYYGLSLVTGSYSVLFVSLAAHAAQFAFLLWFENPHIERIYGGDKKPLVQRQPVIWEGDEETEQHDPETSFPLLSPDLEDTEATPAATDGETDVEPELAEMEPTLPGPRVKIARSDSTASNVSFGMSSSQPKSSTAGSTCPAKIRRKSISMHDLTNRFFRKPVIVLSNVDIFRANDFTFCLLMAYVILTSLSPTPGLKASLAVHFVHALGWRIFHSYGLGLLLRAQSKSKWLVRHFLKHYHYPIETADSEGAQREGVVKRATEEAFGNWQVAYNVSLVMTYLSFSLLAWKTYSLPSDWTVSGTILRHTLGLLLIALHLWSAASSYEVLGDFGWLYSDFFLLEQCPSRLAYTGIYRFLNNPERSMGGAAFLGLSLISGSKLVFTLAIISHLSHWWFLSFVENPHMKSLYGDRLRKDGGLTKTLKSVAVSQAKKLETRAGRHAPEIKRVVQEVRGTLDKVEERLSEAVEEFLGHARPLVSGVVQDTKVLLQQSRERMIITRVASDLASYDAAHYKMALPSGSSSAPTPRFHVGQPIKISWTAPTHHSRKDWIGIYRLGSCKSQLVTRISSMGKWMPLYEEEWDGDQFLDTGSEKKKGDAGEVIFSGEQLPWTPGEYELRLHHDGKHNVMTRVAPIEIFVHQLADESYAAVHQTLLNIVRYSLDCDVALLPRAARFTAFIEALPETDEARFEPPVEVDVDDDRDPDDFVVMEERQAKRIAALVQAACGVELSTEVVIADANVGALTRRVIGAKSLVARAGGRLVG